MESYSRYNFGGAGHVTAIGSIDLDNRYLQEESDTLQTVVNRGATSSTAISITATTTSTSTGTGALTVSGGVGISENLYVGGGI